MTSKSKPDRRTIGASAPAKTRRAGQPPHRSRGLQLGADGAREPDAGRQPALDAVAATLPRPAVQADVHRHAEALLRRSLEKCRTLVRFTVDYVWEIDRTGAIRSLTSRNGKVLGFEPGELIGKRLQDLVPPSQKAAARARLAEKLKARTPFMALELDILGKDGSEAVLEINGVPLFTGRREFDGYQGSGYDVTHRKLAERALEYRDRILDAITRATAELVGAPSVAAAMPTALRIIGRALASDRVMVLRRSGETGKVILMYGWQKPKLPLRLTARHFEGEIVDAADVVDWFKPLAKGLPAVAAASTAKGGLAQLLRMTGAKSILLVPIMVGGRWWGQMGLDNCAYERTWTAAETDTLRIFGEVVGASIMRELHEAARNRAQEELARRARLDPLTGMANRVVFEEALTTALKDAARNNRTFAVHYLDLDHFKDINDTLGHPIGDLLLEEVAERLSDATRHTDMVARFGGDEFAVLQADMAEPGEAGVLAEKLLRLIKQPYSIAGHEIHVGASCGIAVYEPGAPDPEILLAHAELALYRAKSEGRQTFRYFTDSMDEEARSRVNLTDELRRAIDGGQFFLAYQPQVNMEDGRIVGLEALVRWRHPVRGVVSPGEFIAAAERNGLITELGQWILLEACRQTKAWLDAGLDCPPVAVNMSAVQLRRPADAERELAAVLREVQLPRGILQLELTETTLMEAAKAQVDVLERLHADGVRISLDDFGTGFSSLDYLRRYPVDQIKIAQVFVAGIAQNPGDAAIVRAAISLARELHINVLAEGVETLEQAKLLLTWGCREAQGYYFSKPVTADEIALLLSAGRVQTALLAVMQPALPF